MVNMSLYRVSFLFHSHQTLDLELACYFFFFCFCIFGFSCFTWVLCSISIMYFIHFVTKCVVVPNRMNEEWVNRSSSYFHFILFFSTIWFYICARSAIGNRLIFKWRQLDVPLSNEFGGIFKTICASLIMLKRRKMKKKKTRKNTSKKHTKQLNQIYT